jgi:mono/diheme cytochrome c family protein
MKHRRLAVAASSCAVIVACGLAAVTTPSAPTQAQAPLSPVQVKALYTEKCQACHELTGKYDPTVNGYTRQDWVRTVRRMMNKPNSDIAPADADAITGYLAALAPRANNRRGPTDPWATDAFDVWTAAPTATRVFNFEAGNQAADLSPLTAGTAGPAALWHTVAGTTPDGTVMKEAPVKPNASRFALLMDRQDQGRNLDVKVRFQIQAGTVSPAVGIAFGFSGPKTYDVLRFDALHNSLSLLKIDEPTHTTIQTTPVILPSLPTATTAALPAANLPAAAPVPSDKPAAPGWHTLRLLVNNGQIRGWVDMDKRINTQDAGYTGGKVGLWTQGDTVALFDDWTVDLYDSVPPAVSPAQ